MTREDNLAIFWKSLAVQLRKAFPKLEFLRDVNLGALQDDAEVLWKHADREDWWAHTPGLNWTMDQVATIAFVIGKGFKFSIESDVVKAHDWKMSLFGEETLGDMITVNRPRCEVCKSPNLVEIELLLAKGYGYRKLAGVTKFSENTLRNHQKHCMRDRMERLEATMGAVLDLETTMGAAGMLSKAYNKADKLADIAVERNEIALAGTFVDKMKDIAITSAELSGEKQVAAPASGGGLLPQGNGSVNVVFMPTAKRKPPAQIIDGTVIDEE